MMNYQRQKLKPLWCLKALIFIRPQRKNHQKTTYFLKRDKNDEPLKTKIKGALVPIGINLHQASKKKPAENYFLPQEEQNDELLKTKIKATLVPKGINLHQASKKKPSENYLLPKEGQK